jgi:TraM recognition site of TraD and TraG
MAKNLQSYMRDHRARHPYENRFPFGHVWEHFDTRHFADHEPGQGAHRQSLQGSLGTEPSHLLGALLITAFSQAAEARRHMPEDERRDFTLYVDEFQNFATESLASILSEARKCRLSLIAANQHVSQLPETLQNAVFGNTGTLVAFRIGAKDAVLLAEELGLESTRALTTTNNFHA